MRGRSSISVRHPRCRAAGSGSSSPASAAAEAEFERGFLEREWRAEAAEILGEGILSPRSLEDACRLPDRSGYFGARREAEREAARAAAVRAVPEPAPDPDDGGPSP